jgi:predicted DCC family thiol-disulfide oxidoreductase YuxK
MNDKVQQLLTKQPILLYDGECVFCNRSLRFFLQNEKQKNPSSAKKINTVHFAPLQSEVGQALRKYFEIEEKVDSLILIKDHAAYIKSCAALRLTVYMKGLWPLLVVFVIIPPFLRNIVYDFIAKRRKMIFGRSDSCRLFSQEENERMLKF